MTEEATPPLSDVILYSSPKGNVHVEVLFGNDTFWLSQRRMAGLFGVEVHTMNYHLKEIFTSGELREESVIRKFRITAEDGRSYLAKHQNDPPCAAISEMRQFYDGRG